MQGVFECFRGKTLPRYVLKGNSNIIFWQKIITLYLTHWLCRRGRNFLHRRVARKDINAKQKLDLTATHRCSFWAIRSAARHVVLLHLSNVSHSQAARSHCLHRQGGVNEKYAIIQKGWFKKCKTQFRSEEFGAATLGFTWRKQLVRRVIACPE